MRPSSIHSKRTFPGDIEPQPDSPRPRRRAFVEAVTTLQRAASQQKSPVEEQKRNVESPFRLPLSAHPFRFAGNGFSLLEAQMDNRGPSGQRWRATTMKRHLRLCAERNTEVPGSAFVQDHRETFKGQVHLLEGTYLVSNHCRTVQRISPYLGVGEAALRLRPMYERADEELLFEAYKPAMVHAVVSLPRSMGDGALDENIPGFGILSRWMQEPINQTDLLITAEKSRDASYMRVACLKSGRELLSVWLSAAPLMYKTCSVNDVGDRLCLTSTMDNANRVGGGFVMLFWKFFPFRYEGGVCVCKNLFGKDITDACEWGGLLLVTRKGNTRGQLMTIYDLRTFTNAEKLTDVKVGDNWDRARFIGGSNGLLPEEYGFQPRYGQLRCGMPLSFSFTERPPKLYEFFTLEDVAYLAFCRYLILIANKKLAQFELLDVRTGLAIPGPKLETKGADGRPKIVAENVLLIQSTPERLIIWNGVQLKLYGVHRARNGMLELREDFCISAPISVPGWRHVPDWSFNPYLDYDYEFDIVFVVLTDEERGGRVVLMVDGESGSVLSTTELSSMSRPSLNSVPEKDTVEIGEFGLIHKQQLAGITVVNFYSTVSTY
ncbi:hypothetical protein BV898_15231 [Hypsibius exemplaris]|uniref:Uncharacterized protein n=1 Tax=Hypsibius exemplaris TaxID=2072580 RepID=A0A9X6RKA5_HYPEX|nr:hypothetical protein BV898_15231 [Hypsibius exemplaris]OWA50723.1 hypothetical protein BV898_15231 [Hypsibius exemplaris]